MALTDLIAKLTEARPDLAEKMPEKCMCGCECWLAVQCDCIELDTARLIVQGIVAEELAKARYAVLDHKHPTYLDAAVAALCEIARAT